MYMCHVNFALPEGGRIIQPVAFAPENMIVRTAVPSHVPATPEYKALIAAIARDPSIMETLDEPRRFDPEQVCYIRNLRTDENGVAHFLLRRREGDGFVIGYRPSDFQHTVRWILCNAGQQVAGFALPSTCEPEGYTAEKRKGNVQSLEPGGSKTFCVRTGYLDRAEADRMAAMSTLSLHRVPERQAALDDFYRRYESDPLVVDKWFALQATIPEADTLDRVRDLTRHPAFSLRNPNRVRALVWSFAFANQTQFNRADGAGFAFVADHVLALDAMNPQVASRLMATFKSWRALEPVRRARAEAELRRVAAAPSLSTDVHDIVERSLAGA